MKYNFPHEIRLTTEKQFKQVFSGTKQKINTGGFTIYCCCNSLGHPRLGVIVPKRNINKASKRNYFKRFVREHFRLSQHRLKKIDLVFFVNRAAEKMTKKELNKFLENQLDNLKE